MKFAHNRASDGRSKIVMPEDEIKYTTVGKN